MQRIIEEEVNEKEAEVEEEGEDEVEEERAKEVEKRKDNKFFGSL